MKTINFDIAFSRVVSHEQGFQNDPKDRGNWTTGIIDKGENKGTKYGISAMSYPTIDIKNLTIEAAKVIYKRDFWDAVQGDKLSPELVYQLFDAGVNHGIGNAIKMLQRAIGALDDGAFGSKSRKKLEEFSLSDVLMLFLAERLEFMTETKVWNSYGKGWARRIALNLKYAAEDTVE